MADRIMARSGTTYEDFGSVMHRISLDYFRHHQGFVFTHADNNLFVTQLIMREINSSWHHVFVPLCGTLTTIKLI